MKITHRPGGVAQRFPAGPFLRSEEPRQIIAVFLSHIRQMTSSLSMTPSPEPTSQSTNWLWFLKAFDYGIFFDLPFHHPGFFGSRDFCMFMQKIAAYARNLCDISTIYADLEFEAYQKAGVFMRFYL